MTAATIDDLRDAEHKAAAAAERAQAKALDAERTRAEAEAERQQRRDQALHRLMEELRASYRTDYAGTASTAWHDFVDRVREGGDTIAAYRAYREAQIRTYAAWQQFTRYFNRIDDARIMALRETIRDLNVRAGLLDTTPREDRGPTYAAELAAWNSEAAAFTGTDRLPAALPTQIPNDTPRTSSERGMNNDGPRVRKESYSDVLDRALLQLEDELRGQVKDEQKARVAAAYSEAGIE